MMDVIAKTGGVEAALLKSSIFFYAGYAAFNSKWAVVKGMNRVRSTDKNLFNGGGKVMQDDYYI